MAARLLAHLRELASAPQERPSAERREGILTPREQEVLDLIAQGLRDHEIAEQLVLAKVTVKTHVQHILRKLGARNRAEAVARARVGLP